MKKGLLAFALLLLIQSSAWATWSVIAVDKKSGQVIIASATCVAQAGFPKRQPLPSRDLMDLQAVIVPGLGIAACQAGADHNEGKYYTYIRVPDDDIKPTENANPVKTLRMRYDAWKKGGIETVQHRADGGIVEHQ